MNDAKKQMILDGLDLLARQARYTRDYDTEVDANALYAEIKSS